MADFNQGPLPEDLAEIADRLRRERAEPSPLELDRIKLQAMSRAGRPSKRLSKPGLVRTRLVTAVVASALLIAGAGAIGGATGGLPSVDFESTPSVNSQYCPPSSPAAGKPKKQEGGNKCGKDDKKDDKKVGKKD